MMMQTNCSLLLWLLNIITQDFSSAVFSSAPSLKLISFLKDSQKLWTFQIPYLLTKSKSQSLLVIFCKTFTLPH